MVGLWILYGLGLVLGVAIPVGLMIRDRLIGDGQVRTALSQLNQDLQTLGMLSGGPGRMVDALVTDLIERGEIEADDGSLTLTPEVARQLTMPWDHPDQRFRGIHGTVALAVRDGGGEGIWEVRRQFVRSTLWYGRAFAELNDLRLVVSGTRRKWEPAGLGLGILALIWIASIGMMFAGTQYPNTLEDVEVPLSLAVVGWLPVSIGAAFLMSRRRGYHGPDPRTALGMACLAKLGADLPPDATQAQRVALGGFAAMSDDRLRKAIQGNESDSVWRIPRQRLGASAIEEVAAELAGSGGGDGGDSDGGD